MNSTEEIDILVSEVGPRDGLQNAKGLMATPDKLKWIKAEAAAGVREIEVCSFVPPNVVKGMSDADTVVRGAREIDGLTVAALAPNFRGVENAIAAGAAKITLPVSVSESHSLANVRRTPDQMVEEVQRACALRDSLPQDRRPHIEAGLSTAFGCSFEGAVDEDAVRRLAVACVEAGCDEVGLADTAGYAHPSQVKRLFRAVAQDIGGKLGGVHLHNTLGLGLANAMAAVDAGARSLDSSLGGLGGCPFAPGASGNIVTEDLVFLLESEGMTTGIDLEKLIAVRAIVEKALPDDEIFGQVGNAGLPKGWKPAITAV